MGNGVEKISADTLKDVLNMCTKDELELVVKLALRALALEKVSVEDRAALLIDEIGIEDLPDLRDFVDDEYREHYTSRGKRK